jgi:hypothetical protein
MVAVPAEDRDYEVNAGTRKAKQAKQKQKAVYKVRAHKLARF